MKKERGEKLGFLGSSIIRGVVEYIRDYGKRKELGGH